MAKHNDVFLYGFVEEPPTIIFDEKTRTPIRCFFNVLALRGVRDFGNNLDFARVDSIRVMSFRPEIIKIAQNIKSNTMVELKGSFTTKNVKKTVVCEECGHKTSNLGTIGFINPIYLGIRERVLNREEALGLLKEKYEISNQVTVIGMLCREPQLFVTNTGLNIVTYQMAVMRKYKVREENADNTVDFPWIKSYGKLALSDIKALKKGAYVFVDGVIQARDIERITDCENCGHENHWQEKVEEIVPYAVEYLRGHKDIKEIEENLAKNPIVPDGKVGNEDDIEKPIEITDFDVDAFIDEQLKAFKQ